MIMSLIFFYQTLQKHMNIDLYIAPHYIHKNRHLKERTITYNKLVIHIVGQHHFFLR